MVNVFTAFKLIFIMDFNSDNCSNAKKTIFGINYFWYF